MNSCTNVILTFKEIANFFLQINSCHGVVVHKNLRNGASRILKIFHKLERKCT